jgi:hypothetical protein
MSIVGLESMFRQRGGYVGWNRSIEESCLGSPRKPVSVSAKEQTHAIRLGLQYTRILEVELKLLDELSGPLFELVVEGTIEVFRILVVTPRVSSIYISNVSVGLSWEKERCIPDLE